METFVTSIHLLVAIFMILVVLIQGGNQGGISAAFGGGNSQGFFGASGATTLLGKLTYFAAGIFMVTSLWLTVLKGSGGDVGLSEKLKATSSQSQPATSPAEADKPADSAAPASNAPIEAAPAQPSNETPSTTAPATSPEAAPAAK